MQLRRDAHARRTAGPGEWEAEEGCSYQEEWEAEEGCSCEGDEGTAM